MNIHRTITINLIIITGRHPAGLSGRHAGTFTCDRTNLADHYLHRASIPRIFIPELEAAAAVAAAASSDQACNCQHSPS